DRTEPVAMHRRACASAFPAVRPFSAGPFSAARSITIVSASNLAIPPQAILGALALARRLVEPMGARRHDPGIRAAIFQGVPAQTSYQRVRGQTGEVMERFSARLAQLDQEGRSQVVDCRDLVADAQLAAARSQPLVLFGQIGLGAVLQLAGNVFIEPFDAGQL